MGGRQGQAPEGLGAAASFQGHWVFQSEVPAMVLVPSPILGWLPASPAHCDLKQGGWKLSAASGASRES